MRDCFVHLRKVAETAKVATRRSQHVAQQLHNTLYNMLRQPALHIKLHGLQDGTVYLEGNGQASGKPTCFAVL